MSERISKTGPTTVPIRTRLRSAWWLVKLAVTALWDHEHAERMVMMCGRLRLETEPHKNSLEMLEVQAGTAALRMQYRVDACLEREGSEESAVVSSGIGISYLFAREIACTLQEVADLLGGVLYG